MKINLYAFVTTAFSILLLTAITPLTHAQSSFVTIWKTDNPGVSGANQITIPALGDYTYTWENINNPASTGLGSVSGETTITFPQAGSYEVRMLPVGSTPFDYIEFIRLGNNDKFKLIEIKNWGTVQWRSFQFDGCSNLKITATDIPDLSNVTNLSYAFSNSGVDYIPNINSWDVSNVTDMSSMFANLLDFNQSLSDWDVSNVMLMDYMFDGASSFNQPLNSWNVSRLQSVNYMFRRASSFDQPLHNWSLNNFTGGIGMFYQSGLGCENYSLSLYGWANNSNTATGVVLHPYGPGYSPDVVPYRNYLINSLGWTIMNDALGSCAVVLAVDFLYFNARQVQHQASLQWATASESDNKGFYIERSSDGLNWETIGFIPTQSAEGNSSQQLNYNFNDAEPVYGSNFYRLKQMDFDGDFEYSLVKKITFTQAAAISIYPNPVKDHMVVSGLTGNETIKLYDLTGREFQLSAMKGNPASINLSNFSRGVYYLRITLANGQMVSQKVIKR